MENTRIVNDSWQQIVKKKLRNFFKLKCVLYLNANTIATYKPPLLEIRIEVEFEKKSHSNRSRGVAL